MHLAPERIPEPSAERFDAAAARLFETLLAASCGDSFPLSLNAALAAGLRLLDAEPDLAEILLDPDPVSRDLLKTRDGWQRTFGHLLHSAARRSGCRQAPFFLEPQLIAGVNWIAAAARCKPEITSYAETRASLLEYLLVYYLEPEDLGPTVLACLDA
jgi:hypothetical protein